MKLPEGKKERTQILILAGIVALVAIYAVVYFVAIPLSKSKKAKLAKIAELSGEIEKASRTIQGITRDKDLNAETIRKILHMIDTYVLTPRLGGNYQLSAEEVIERNLVKAKINIEKSKHQTRALGTHKALKLTQIRESNAFATFTLALTMQCSYHNAMRFIRAIEDENPYVCVKNISISDLKDQIEEHSVALQIEWLILENEELPNKLRQQLQDYTSESGVAK
ncbi:MAG: hypothetical protein JXN60_07920 [Lentisphaerae bacterium]|nr:hypothetical protein [Lentisphaerota bacterium]